MGKQIKLTLNQLPSPEQHIKYTVTIGGVPVPYNTGLTILDIRFSNDVTSVSNVKIKPTIAATLNELVFVLTTYYTYPTIQYSIYENSVIVNIKDISADVIDISFPNNGHFSFVVSSSPPSENYFLKYFMEYSGTQNDIYKVELLKKGFVGTPTLVFGSATLTKGSVKDSLETIRGTGLDIELEADVDLNFEDLYTDEENQYKAKFYRNGVLLFLGFLKPDGIFQSFVTDRWVMSVSCVDGLGILKDLAFVKQNGLHWIGKQSALEIIQNCLVRTNTYLDLNTAVNVYYKGLTPSDNNDPLTKIFMNVDRFVKSDNDTIMDCEEVLKSVLDLFNAQITQFNGEWYIERANEVVDGAVVKFRKYDKFDNSFKGINTKNEAFTLGNQANNRYPHHCSGNQQISIKGTVAAYRINYKYGFLSGLLKNPTLLHNGLDYLDWELLSSQNIITDPSRNTGLTQESITDPSLSKFLLKSESFVLLAGDTVELKVSATLIQDSFTGSETTYQYSVKTNSGKSLDINGKWVNYLDSIITPYLNFSVKSDPLPSNETVFIQIGSAYTQNVPQPEFVDTIVYRVDNIDLINTTNNNNGAVGEFHTVKRKDKTSSIARENTTIFNGDSPSIIYQGAIFKNDQTTPTSLWFRKGKIESKCILQISGEDVLRMNPKPSKVFTGDAYGYIPYLSIISIDNILGKFKFIEYSFDSKSNITSFKLHEVFNDELDDIDYKLTYDYGSTVKPTITS